MGELTAEPNRNQNHHTGMKSITVEVSPEGEVKIEAAGFRGNSCEKATAALEQAMGLPGKRKHKPEYHAQEGVTQKVG
jgi:hypothetical protein